jgi:hypothetical protein
MFEEKRKTLKETQAELKTAVEGLKELGGVLLTGDGSVLDRHSLALEKVREIRDEFAKQLDALCVVLDGDRKLYRPQYESLTRFAENNSIQIEDVLSRVEIKDGVVTKCVFEYQNLRTLEGLEGLPNVRELVLFGNRWLHSLRGVPVQSLQKIDVRYCGLWGDLMDLQGASSLNFALVRGCKRVTSLRGIPTQSLELVDASYCNLQGDLAELEGACNLKEVFIEGNEGISSLKGMPLAIIKKIEANGSNLNDYLLEVQRSVDLSRHAWVTYAPDCDAPPPDCDCDAPDFDYEDESKVEEQDELGEQGESD